MFDATQALAGILTCLFHELFIATASPYTVEGLNIMSLLASVQLLVTLIVGVACKAQRMLFNDSDAVERLLHICLEIFHAWTF